MIYVLRMEEGDGLPMAVSTELNEEYLLKHLPPGTWTSYIHNSKEPRERERVAEFKIRLRLGPAEIYAAYVVTAHTLNLVPKIRP